MLALKPMALNTLHHDSTSLEMKSVFLLLDYSYLFFSSLIQKIRIWRHTLVFHKLDASKRINPFKVFDDTQNFPEMKF